MSPQLLIRMTGGAWQPVTAPRRGWLGWAFAPASNLALAYHSTVEHLVAEVDQLDPATDHEAPAITGLVSYALVTEVARQAVRAGAWQWKIMVLDGAEWTDYLVSPEYPA